jgi:hypothetical protein
MAAAVALRRVFSRCRLGAACRPRGRNVPLLAGALRSRAGMSAVFLVFVVSCQRGGRRFEPGLVLQDKRTLLQAFAASGAESK